MTKEIELEEVPTTLQTLLVLEGDGVPEVVILEQTEAEVASGTLRVRAPFYIGESITRPPGFPKRVYFPTNLLSETVKEGKQQIESKQQPLTIYGRHNHAISGNHLPIGGIVGLEQEGRIGYAILEIEPTTEGKDAQILIKGKKLNAISLRAGPKRFELEEVQVNGEAMYKATKLRLDGVDFAPDHPAMGNYGFELLAAEAVVEPITKKKEVSLQVPDELTLEAVRANPAIVSEIEKPLLASLDAEKEKTKSLLAEVEAFKEKVAKSELLEFVKNLASKHPKKDEILPIFLEIAENCKTREEFSAQVLPLFVDAAQSLTPAPKTPLEKLQDMFTPTHSQTLIEESEEEEEIKGTRVGALEVPE